VPTHEAAFQVLRSTEIEANDFLHYPLLRLAEEIFVRFSARNRQEELHFGLLRVAVSTYSETGFREALANALIHRDYTRRGVERTGRGIKPHIHRATPFRTSRP
jgi:ATP-dependent DNA helicase RecG